MLRLRGVSPPASDASEVQAPGPSTDADGRRDLPQPDVGSRQRRGGLALEQLSQRDLTGGAARLCERHRTHQHAADASDAGVTSDVVLRQRRAGEDELARQCTVIAFPAYAIPQLRRVLPLVEQPRGCASEHCSGIGIGQQQQSLVVQTSLAAREVSCGPRLAAPAATLDQDRSSPPERALNAGADDAGQVARHRECLRCVALGVHLSDSAMTLQACRE